jgi:adenylate cyclase
VTLRAILEESIKPWMIKSGLDSKDFGFRIGCDFGNDDEVLWGSFGYQNVGEISATGLPVDMASKLQSLAGKNEAMLGQGLLDFIDWPEKFSKIKTRNKEGSVELVPIVKPNITRKDGTPLNYIMKQLDYSKSLEFSALPLAFREKVDNVNVRHNSNIDFKCYTIKDTHKKEYISASYFLDKNLDLLFEVTANTNNRLSFPLKVLFIKTNNGSATPKDERGVEQKAVTEYLSKKRISNYNSTFAPYSKIELKEATQYRGLHTMKCEVFDNDGYLLFRDCIGVMIK